jgi:predicted metalloenzyme YecM
MESRMNKKGYLKNKNGRLILSVYKPYKISSFIINCLFVPSPKKGTNKSVISTSWAHLIPITPPLKRTHKIELKGQIEEYVKQLMGNKRKGFSKVSVELIGKEKFTFDFHDHWILYKFPKTYKENK